jgi:hypothetical protein
MKINLDTRTKALELFQIASKLQDQNIYLVNGDGTLRAHAKSIVGALYSMEFEDLWIESEQDHYFAFKDFATE